MNAAKTREIAILRKNSSSDYEGNAYFGAKIQSNVKHLQDSYVPDGC